MAFFKGFGRKLKKLSSNSKQTGQEETSYEGGKEGGREGGRAEGRDGGRGTGREGGGRDRQEASSSVSVNYGGNSSPSVDKLTPREKGFKQPNSDNNIGRDEFIRLHDPLPTRPRTVIGTKETFNRMSLNGSQSDFLPQLDVPRIKSLLETLKKLPNCGTECQEALSELRTLSKTSRMYRMFLSENGAIEIVLDLLHSEDKLVVEHSVTSLLNLALEPDLKSKIGNPLTIFKLSELMETAETEKTRENAGGAICNLCVSPQCRLLVKEAGVIPKILNLVKKKQKNGNDNNNMVRRDAVVGLLSLSLDNECRESVVEIGAINILMEILEDPETNFEDEVLAVIATLVKSSKGCEEMENENAVYIINMALESGSERGRAAAVSILLQVALRSERGRGLVANETLISTLRIQAKKTTGRKGYEKAQQLLDLFEKSANPRNSFS